MDKIMHWDLQTYLTGLFHQDDRMSMASSLESRVPLADPRLVRFAFKVPADLRFRSGASKWVLRKAVSTMLPSLVLNRRKVGFDTPAEAWLNQHNAFVRDTLLSSRSMSRGFWNRRGIESLLESKDFDRLWKVLSIELWASIFLDSRPPSGLPESARPVDGMEVRTPVTQSSAPEIEAKPPLSLKFRYLARECVELGVKGTVARGAWEIKLRGGLTRLAIPDEFDSAEERALLTGKNWSLPFADPLAVGGAMRRLLPAADADRLAWLASESTRGRILCFGRWMADFGNPVDWHRDPTNESRWPADAHWAKALRTDHPHTDVKLTWEAGRFPQAYFLARAAALDPAAAPAYADAFGAQVRGFIDSNPPGLGLHWFSGQEIAFRQFAWLFGVHVFSGLGMLPDSLRQTVGIHLAASAAHIARHIEYARDSVYNNHLLSEALGLFVGGTLLSGADTGRWKTVGYDLLVEEADRQVYPDGGYIQQSHTYQRVAMEVYLWATAFLRANGAPVPGEWLRAMERSLDFLLAHQNDTDGRLPNFGSNDGSDPVVLCTSDFTDFRPILQALSIATRGERLYDPGPHDEAAAWLFGPASLDAPLRPRAKTSVSLGYTGYHVIRGIERTDASPSRAFSGEPGSFGAFRCGSILDRFAQIDMLHLDIWWRGENVLADGGSYLYNGPPAWHNYFLRTGSHNTVQIDGRDQMPHVRQFKTLYRTQARLLSFEDNSAWALCNGEHYGYLRTEHCLHRRSVLYLKRDDVWIVVDTVSGTGSHRARLHWLAGDYPYRFDASSARLTLQTPKGDFPLTVLGSDGAPLPGADVVVGGENPARGWLSRYYGEKVPVPSLAASQSGPVPITFVTLAGAAEPVTTVDGDLWTVTVNESAVSFRILSGSIENVGMSPAALVGKVGAELRQ
jgi:asparagine synthase (glutamine-hydrolysing)